MIKSALVVGSGEIADKHEKALRLISKNFEITRLKNRGLEFFLKRKKTSKKFNLIVICSPSSEHFKNINLLEKYFKKIPILIEKPLFNKTKKIKTKFKNSYYVGYNLRFHPVIQFLKRYLEKKEIFFINAHCSSYLPNWRKKKNYRNSVSAQKKFGGGVILELSHEIDYLIWILKGFRIKYSYNRKISDLDINVEDVFNLVAEKNKKTLINLSINFFSRIEKRFILVDGKNFSIVADLIKNKIKIFEKDNLKLINFKKFKMIDSYKIQNYNLIKNNRKNLCDIKQGIKVLKVISQIKKNS